MTIARLTVGLLGACLLAWLLLRLDVGSVFAALSHVGWLGFGLVLTAGFVLTFCLSSGLYPLISEYVSPVTVLVARQVRDSAGDILPFTQVGGMAAGVRVLILAGLAPARAIAAGMVDVTAELLAQSLFILLGLGLAAPAMQADPHWAPYLGWLVGGTALFALAILGFALAQLAGSHLAEKAMRPAAFGASAAAFRDALHQLYRHRGRVALSVVLHLFGWCASGLWLWVVFRVLGHPISPASAIAIQALLEGLRSATVFIPAAIGVQEAGYAALAPLFGLGPEVGLAASLLRRARDIAIGVPVLLLWQLVEARRVSLQN
jgi:putative membrane protein